MKKTLALILILGASTAFAQDKKMDTKTHFVAEALERTLYEIHYDEKTGKAEVKQHAQKKPYLDVTHPDGWKGDMSKADKAIRTALNDFRKKQSENKADAPATLWSEKNTRELKEFGDGFVIGFTAPFKLISKAFGG